ncbi:MAG TPA: ABC transporter permease [Ktedonobacterales bacterium]|nr:ABC transporter permease [Ktedonobacterales bacterium]
MAITPAPFAWMRRWRTPRAGEWWRALVPPAALLGALLLLWQGVATALVRDDQVLPPPGQVARALVTQRDLLWTHTLVTLWETLVGFAVALAVGLALAAVIDLSPWLRRAFYPVLVISQTIPIITLAPLLVFWFGFGLTSKVIVVTLVCFFPIVVAAVDGLRGTDPELIKLYRTFGAGAARIFWSVRVPGALPAVFSGVRIAITYSVIGAIFGEYVGASAGLGFYMLQQQHNFGINRVIAAIVVTALLSVALFGATALVERLVLPWYYATGRAVNWRERPGAARAE